MPRTIARPRADFRPPDAPRARPNVVGADRYQLCRLDLRPPDQALAAMDPKLTESRFTLETMLTRTWSL
jgi:hypothetical protein